MKDKIKELGVEIIVGFEIHQQLTEKLFCDCKIVSNKRSTLDKRYRNTLTILDKDTFEINFRDYNYLSTTKICEYQLDEKEPVLNQNILFESLLISKQLGASIKTSSSFLRKRILDGSLYSGFQRTMIIAESEDYEIRLQEDSCSMFNNEGLIYKLDRQGIALVEVASKPYVIKTEEDLVNFVEKLKETGRLIRLNNIKRDSSSIRQDINISINKGPKVEIKGVSSFDLITNLIISEVIRQKEEGVTEPHTRKIQKEDNDKIITSYLRSYEGDSRYFSDPELPTIFLDQIKIEGEYLRRRMELDSLLLLNNPNIIKEVDKIGITELLSRIKRTGRISVLELSKGQLTCILSGKTPLSYTKLKKEVDVTKDLNTNQIDLRKKGLYYNKYDLLYLLGLLEADKYELTSTYHTLNSRNKKPTLLKEIEVDYNLKVNPSFYNYYEQLSYSNYRRSYKV